MYYTYTSVWCVTSGPALVPGLFDTFICCLVVGRVWTLMAQNCEEWLIGQKVGKPSGGASVGWRNGGAGTSGSSTESVEYCTRGGKTPCISTWHGLTSWKATLQKRTFRSWRESLAWVKNLPLSLLFCRSFLVVFPYSLFSAYFFFNYYYLVLIVLIFLPHGKYAGFIQAASAFRKAVILSHPLLSSFREDFQA